MEESIIIEKGDEIIHFIESNYDIESYSTEYFEKPNKILKIVFNYQFYVLYDFDKKTLLEIDYNEKETDITNDFNNFSF